jgi:hypothetical protein
MPLNLRPLKYTKFFCMCCGQFDNTKFLSTPGDVWGGVGYSTTQFLTLALDVGELSASHTGCFTPKLPVPTEQEARRDPQLV